MRLVPQLQLMQNQAKKMSPEMSDTELSVSSVDFRRPTHHTLAPKLASKLKRAHHTRQTWVLDQYNTIAHVDAITCIFPYTYETSEPYLITASLNGVVRFWRPLRGVYASVGSIMLGSAAISLLPFGPNVIAGCGDGHIYLLHNLYYFTACSQHDILAAQQQGTLNFSRHEALLLHKVDGTLVFCGMDSTMTNIFAQTAEGTLVIVDLAQATGTERKLSVEHIVSSAAPYDATSRAAPYNPAPITVSVDKQGAYLKQENIYEYFSPTAPPQTLPVPPDALSSFMIDKYSLSLSSVDIIRSVLGKLASPTVDDAPEEVLTASLYSDDSLLFGLRGGHAGILDLRAHNSGPLFEAGRSGRLTALACFAANSRCDHLYTACTEPSLNRWDPRMLSKPIDSSTCGGTIVALRPRICRTLIQDTSVPGKLNLESLSGEYDERDTTPHSALKNLDATPVREMIDLAPDPSSAMRRAYDNTTDSETTTRNTGGQSLNLPNGPPAEEREREREKESSHPCLLAGFHNGQAKIYDACRIKHSLALCKSSLDNDDLNQRFGISCVCWLADSAVATAGWSRGVYLFSSPASSFSK